MWLNFPLIDECLLLGKHPCFPIHYPSIRFLIIRFSDAASWWWGPLRGGVPEASEAQPLSRGTSLQSLVSATLSFWLLPTTRGHS